MWGEVQQLELLKEFESSEAIVNCQELKLRFAQLIAFLITVGPGNFLSSLIRYNKCLIKIRIYQIMTSFENPKAIRHFQSICDNLQDLVTRFHTPSDLKLYSDGYLQALRNCNGLEQNDQEKLEKLIERWILDPSSFIDPEWDGNKGFFDKKRI